MPSDWDSRCSHAVVTLSDYPVCQHQSDLIATYLFVMSFHKQ